MTVLNLIQARMSARKAYRQHVDWSDHSRYYGTNCRTCNFWEGYLRCIDDMALRAGTDFPLVQTQPPSPPEEPKLTTSRAINFED